MKKNRGQDTYWCFVHCFDTVGQVTERTTIWPVKTVTFIPIDPVDEENSENG